MEAAGAEYVAAADSSCLMHIDGVLRRRKLKARTIHLASILAKTGATTGRELATPSSQAVP